MTLPLPTRVDDPRTQQVLDFLAQLFPLGNANLASPYTHGSTEVEWPGESVESSNKTVTHGLGGTPSAVIVCMSDNDVWAAHYVDAKGETTFQIKARTVDETVPAEGFKANFDWVAIA